MARDESDREDLLAEATALVERVELRLRDFADSLVAGFRKDGGLSLFFGADPVFQFNSAHELRRAFVAGEMYKARSGRLVVMRRERTDERVSLLSRELLASEQSAFLAVLDRRLDELDAAMARESYQVVGQVPADGQVVVRLAELLAGRTRPVRVANSPRAGGR